MVGLHLGLVCTQPKGGGRLGARLIGEAVGHAGPKALHAHRPEERQSRRPLGEPRRLHHPLRNLGGEQLAQRGRPVPPAN